MTKLIALEGIDGAGTTTQAERLARRFDLHLTSEPSDRAVGRLLRDILHQHHDARAAVDERAVALLFAADRLDHVFGEIAAQRRDVITDRYVLSSLVYQSLSVDRQFIATINQFAPPADLTILLDVPAEVAAERRAARGGAHERYDHDETQRRLAEGYRHEIVQLHNYAVVDGTGSADEVFARLEPLVQSCLARR
jgi:dTMP kinase